MEEVTLQKEALSQTRQNLKNYFETHDVNKYLAEDVVFRNLSTGETYTGRSEVGGMLHFIYHVAFDAKGEVVDRIQAAQSVTNLRIDLHNFNLEMRNRLITLVTK